METTKIQTEKLNKYIEERKNIIRENIDKKELNEFIYSVVERLNIKFKNEESKIIAKDLNQSLYALKMSKMNERKIRESVSEYIKSSVNVDQIEDIDLIIDSFLIRYNGFNNVHYLYLNY